MSTAKPAKGIPVSSKIPTSGRDSGTHSRSSSVSNLTSASDIHSETGDAMSENALDFKVDDRVWVNGTKPGCVKFLGKTQFAPGVWAGVLLDEPIGKNDGSVSGVKYFSCEPLRGIFARPQKLARSPGPISGDASNAGSPRGSTCSINITTPSNRGLPSASLQSSGTRVCSRLRIGERIMVSSSTGVKTGILRFLGETDFAKGEWAGIELDEPVGKNDGSVAGKRYFSCAMKYGLFSPLHKISRAGGTMTPRSTSSIRGTPIMRSTSRDSLSSSVSNSSKASSRVRLGVTALTNSKSKPRPGMGLMTTSRALEETLKEKEQHIEQLLKEHDLEKIELARISVRCKEAEAKYAELQKEQQGIESERKNLEEQLCADKRKLEDLQFQLEEEKIMKSDVEMHLEQQKTTVKRIEEFIENKTDGKFINIKEILDGKENLSEIPEQHTDSPTDIPNEKILTLEANLKHTLEEKNKTMKELDDLRTRLNDNEKQSENLSSTLNVTIQEKDDVISNLKNELSSQLEKVTKLMEDNKNLNEQIILHASETKQHSDEVVKEFGEKIKLLSEDLNSKNSRLEEFENSMQEEDSKISLLENSLETQVQQLTEMTNQNQSLQQTLALKDVELTEKLALQKSLESEVAALKSQVDSEIPKHEEKILGLVKDIERLTGSLQEKEDELILKQTEITNLSKKIEELLDSNSQMQTKLKETEENVSSVNQKNLEKITTLENEIQLLKEEKEHTADKLQKELEVKQTDFEVLSQELETKKTLLSEKEAHISQLNVTLGDKESECLKIQAGLNEVKQNCEILTDEKANVIKTLEEKEKLVSDFETQLQDANNKLEEKNKEIEESKKSTDSLQDILRQKEDENIQLNSKLQLAEQNVEMLNKDSSEHVMTLQNELSKLKDESTKARTNLEQEIAKMQEEIKEMSTSISEKDNSLKEKDESISVIQDQVKMKENDVSNLSCQIEKLEKELSTLSNSNKELVEKHEKQVSTFKEEFSCELKKKEVELAEIQEENKKLSATISETNSALEEKMGSSSILQNQLKAKEDEVCELSEKVKKLDQDLVALSKDKGEIQLSLEKQLQTVKDELNLTLKKKDEVLQDGQTKLSESNELLEAKDAELQQKESVITSLKAVVTEKESQFDELSQMIESSQAQLKKLEEQNRNNLKLLESKETFINEFKAEKENNLFTLQENYKQEKSQFEEAVKRHESEIKAKDDIIVKLNAEAEEQKKVIDVIHEELKSTKTSSEAAVQNTNEVHKGFVAKIAELEEKYTKLLEEKKKVEDEENKAKGEKKDLEAARDSLLKEKVQQEVVVKDKEAKLEALQAEVSRMQVEFTRHKQELEQKLDVSEMEKEAALELKSQLELQHSVLEELQQELQNSDKKNKDLELKLKEMSNLSSEKTELLNKLNEFEKLDKEKSERILSMEEKYQSLEESLENTRNALRVKEVECLSFSSKIQNSESEKESKEKLKLSLKSLEQENILLKHRIEKLESAPEKKLSGPSEDNGSQLDSEERESLISQIDFLNSIIVDMKQKNENLQQDIEVFKMGPPLELDSNLNDVKKKIAPRLFCDICDMFDLHDTDDCPKQSSFIEDEAVPHLIPQGARKLEERPYCNNCEVFGHWTLECEEQETY